MDEVQTRRIEAVCQQFLARPLPLALGGLCLVQLATWLPGYLTWPWWADHDVFATMARAWDAGVRPYRDFLGNNFPATVYVFWLLGRTFGWGKTAPFWAFDAALVVAYGALLLAWSRRRLGGPLPGLCGYALFLGYYLNLDYTQAAQRDWHAPFFAVAALLILQTWPGHAGRIAAGLATACAVAFRPQVVLLFPALTFAAWSPPQPSPPGSGWRRSRRVRASLEPAPSPSQPADHRSHHPIRAVLEWALATLLGLTLAFAPLAAEGLIPDFLRSLASVSYGGSYNRVSPSSFLTEALRQLGSMKLVAVPLFLALLWPGASDSTRRVAWPWLVALAGVFLYRPLSPVAHAYLSHPLTVVWCVLAAILAGLIQGDVRLLPTLRLGLIVLLLGLGVTAKPRFSTPNGCRDALVGLWRGEDPRPCPPGYAPNREVRCAARYEWSDYRALLDFLRHQLPPEATVANVLAYVPAVAGPAGRLSAFPAESVAWLTVVHRDDEPRFAEALRDDPYAVVVWSPAERYNPNLPHLERLDAVIRKHFEPHRRFGAIEVWTRRAAPAFAAN